MEPLLSVIIPVYNVESYLMTCVDSVLAQTMREFEIILIDDGSTDGSGAMCDRYAAADARVRVVHQANGGLSGARNTGLRHAAGAHVLFLDADDFYVSETMLDELLPDLQKTDVVCFNYARYTTVLQKPLITPPATLPLSEDKATALHQLMCTNAYVSSACLKAVRRRLLTGKDIFFKENTCSEDIEWSAQVMRAAASFAFVNKTYYAYRVRQGSITHSVDTRHVTDLSETLERLVDKKVVDDLPAPIRDSYLAYVAFQYATFLINIWNCPRSDHDRFLSQAEGMGYLLDYGLCVQLRIIRAVRRLAGIRCTSRLLHLYYRLFGK